MPRLLRPFFVRTAFAHAAAPALLAAVLLAACAGEPEPPPAADDGALVLSDDGLGGLSAETPFDTAAVRAALPAGFAVEVHPAAAGPGVWALRDGLLVLEVSAGADGLVGRIDAASDQVAGPTGARTGQSYVDAGGDAMRCDPGVGEFAARVVCRPRRGSPLRYVFAHAAAPGTEPTDDQLAAALLERIVWTAE